MPTSRSVYNDSFFASQVRPSIDSAYVYANILKSHFSPSSITDVGCGRAAWLYAFADIFELSTDCLTGIDGPWNPPDKQVVKCSYLQCDLNNLQQLLHTLPKADLAICLEAAEHIEPQNSESLVFSLTFLSDAILFSSATLGQSGIGHINERYPSYWASLFAEKFFYPFDLFRESVWSNKSVQPWYKQNAYLYVHKDSELFTALISGGCYPIANTSFMNAYHPQLFYDRSTLLGFLKYKIHCFFPDHVVSFLHSIYKGMSSLKNSSSGT